jgi:hypothetical protein
MRRKNKKRIDPRYFLHELQEEEIPMTPPSGAPVAEAPPAPGEEAAAEADEPTEPVDLRNLSDEQQKGAELMLQLVQSALGTNALAKDDLERGLENAGYTSEEKEQV